MEKEINYKTAFSHISKGCVELSKLIPVTFMSNMKDIVINHYIFLLFVSSVISFQAYSYVNMKRTYDRANKTNAELEQRLDSALMKDVKYTSYNYNPYKQ